MKRSRFGQPEWASEEEGRLADELKVFLEGINHDALTK